METSVGAALTRQCAALPLPPSLFASTDLVQLPRLQSQLSSPPSLTISPSHHSSPLQSPRCFLLLLHSPPAILPQKQVETTSSSHAKNTTLFHQLSCLVVPVGTCIFQRNQTCRCNPPITTLHHRHPCAYHSTKTVLLRRKSIGSPRRNQRLKSWGPVHDSYGSCDPQRFVYFHSPLRSTKPRLVGNLLFVM